MPKVIWPAEVIDQLGQIKAYIKVFDPTAANRITNRLIDLGNSLAEFPNRDRLAANGTRQIATVPPYVLSYDVMDDAVLIVDVRHGARRPFD